MEEIRLSDHFGYKRLIRFTLPTIAMMLCTSIYGIVDGLFISNVVGSTAFAAANLIWPFVSMLSTVGFMAGTGGAALVSKTLGEGREELANEYFSMLIYFILIVGIIFSVAGNLFIDRIAVLLGADEELLDGCVAYGSILLISLPAFMLECTFQAFLVVAERPRMGFAISVACGIANVIMDFLVVYLLQCGIKGAAWATAVSQFVGALIPLIFFMRKNNGTCLHLVRTGLRFAPIIRANINGASEMVSGLSMSLVEMLYNLQLMRMAGSDGVVAYGIIMYVAFVFNGTYGGYAQGVAPVISYHYGAGDKKELHSLLLHSLALITAFSVTMTLLSEILAGLQAGIFVGYNPDLRAFTVNAIRLYSLSYIISGINIFASSFFTALNNGLVSAAISFLRTFIFLATAILVMPIILGLNGIWLAVLAAEAASLLVSAVFLKADQKRYGY